MLHIPPRANNDIRVKAARDLMRLVAVHGPDLRTSRSARMNSDDNPRSMFPSHSRPILSCSASFIGRFTSAPSVANAPNEPT